MMERDDWEAIREKWPALKERLEFKADSLERKIRFAESQTINWKGKPFNLRPKQFLLLKILRDAKGKLLTRQEINAKSGGQFDGANAVRNVLNQLEEEFKELRACVYSCNSGFAFRLPPVQ